MSLLREMEGKTTAELMAAAQKQLTKLGKLIERRKNKDAAFTNLTDFFLLIQGIGMRLEVLEFMPGKALEEEEDEDNGEKAEPAAMADLFAEPDGETVERVDFLQRGICEDCQPKCEELHGELHDLRLRDFRVCLDLMVRGTRDVEEVTKRVLSIVRRTKPELLREHFGLSQADVSRRLGETRQTTQAREKKIVEEPMKKSGALGYKLAGGTRSEEHRERCAKAQRGNRHRHDAEQRRRQRD